MTRRILATILAVTTLVIEGSGINPNIGQNPLPEASIATAVTRSNRNTGWPKPQNEPTLGRNLNRWRILSDGLHQDDNHFRLVYWLKASSYSEHS